MSIDFAYGAAVGAIATLAILALIDLLAKRTVARRAGQ